MGLEATNGASSFMIECPAVNCPTAKASRAPDITRSRVPLMIVASLVVFAAGAAFQIGGIYADLSKERSEILERLDGIEGAIRKLVPSYTPQTHKRARARGGSADQG